MNPRVSICIPTYNRAATLRQTIEAMLAQTFTDWELIVCDDASTDDTPEVVGSFKDTRIRYQRHATNLGLYANWNYGIGLATGEYIAIYHDHDIYQPTIVERSVALLERHPTASFVHTALQLIDEHDSIVGIDVRDFQELTPGIKIRRNLAKGWHSPVMAATVMVRRAAYRQVGAYQFDEYGLGCDLDMWFQLCQVGDIAYVKDPQALIRIRTKGQGTARFNWTTVVGAMKMRRDHLRRAFSPPQPDYYWQQARYHLQRDITLATLGVRATLLESADVVNEGEKVLQIWASFWVRGLYRVTRRSTFMRNLLRKFVLPIHYSNVNKQEAARQREVAPHNTRN